MSSNSQQQCCPFILFVYSLVHANSMAIAIMYACELKYVTKNQISKHTRETKKKKTNE